MRTAAALWDPWVWTMAWRDGRSHSRKLLLFMLCIGVGIAALVSIRSLGDNLEAAVEAEARTLLGADLMVSSRGEFSTEAEALFDSIGVARAREVRFGSMVYFPKSEGTRLVQVRALSGGFPYYGELETDPVEAADRYQSERTALVDQGLMLQFGVDVGDSMKIGQATFRIGGSLQRVPGETSITLTTAPPIYITGSTLEETGLIQVGSLASYRAYFRLEDPTHIRETLAEIRPRMESMGLRYETVSDRKRRMNRTLGNLYHFLSLVGFVALLLACVGVASAVHVYVRQKLDSVAVLRCVGARAGQAFTMYMIQVGAMGLAGSVLGAILGIVVQEALPSVVGPLVPVKVPTGVSWPAVLEGMSIGLTLGMLLALYSLLPVRRVSPLRTLRSSYEEADVRGRDLLQLAVVAGAVVLVGGLAVLQTGRLFWGIGLTGGLGVAFGLLAGTSFFLMRMVRRYFPATWRYVWRQGLANLYRPHNQTTVLMLSLGLGTFLIATLYIAQYSLLREIELAGSNGKSNFVLFDLQVDQVDEAVAIIESQGLKIIHRAPVVTMRLASVEGRSVKDILADSSRSMSRWALTREYRSTYRDHLFDTEQILSGTWTPRVGEADEPVPISLEKGLARSLGLSIGQSMSFDVQGIPVKTAVGSLREVDWQRLQPNFMVVFPEGVLEPAPQFFVLTTEVKSEEQSAALQLELVLKFPNVSAIDLGLVLKTVDNVLSQVGFVIQFMALFSILTGVTVLASAVLTSRYLRIREGVLLRTLGASRRQIRQILFVEYLFLGGLAAASGMLLAVGGGWALTQFAFEIAFVVPVTELGVAFAAVTMLTVLLGMLGSRGIAERPPLEVLRAEG